MWGKDPEAKPSPAPEPIIAAVPVRSPSPSAPESRSEPSRITPSLTLKGAITGREDLYLDGTMEGTIRVPESRVTIGPNGRVAADIEANEIIVEGSVRGSLQARTRVELRKTCSVRGDMVTRGLAVQEGARFSGKIEMVRGDEARVPRGAAVPSAAGADDLRAVRVEAKDSVS